MKYGDAIELEQVIQEMDNLSYRRGIAEVSYNEVAGWVATVKSYRQYVETRLRDLESWQRRATEPCPLPPCPMDKRRTKGD